MAADLNSLLRLKTTVFGMKMFKRREDMEAIPKIRRPKAVHTMDQIVAGVAARLDRRHHQRRSGRRAVPRGGRSRRPQDETWQSGENMPACGHAGGDAQAPGGDGLRARRAIRRARGGAIVIGRLDPPDIALFYATPGAMIYFINGLQWSGYKRFDWSMVGKSACADSWGRALTTRLPSLSIRVSPSADTAACSMKKC